MVFGPDTDKTIPDETKQELTQDTDEFLTENMTYKGRLEAKQAQREMNLKRPPEEYVVRIKKSA